MHLNTRGQITEEKTIRAGFIGCGSHSFRNLFSVFPFTHVDLTAVCDFDLEKAKEFANTFGAESAYDNHHNMIARDDIDAVFICTGYDKQNRPFYPRLAADVMNAGKHVWIEKPPAGSRQEIEEMKSISATTGKTVMCGLKKMFFPANKKALELMQEDSFGQASLVQIQYPQFIPKIESLRNYVNGGPGDENVQSFLDHICHPASLMLLLKGRPISLYYERSAKGSGAAIFTFADQSICTMSFTEGASPNGGLERTHITGCGGSHITIENCHKVTLHRTPELKYGLSTDFYSGDHSGGSLVWEPEFSLGSLYNKGIYLLGYQGEVEEFAQAVIENRQPIHGHLDDALAVTAIFEAFQHGSGQVIKINY